MPTDEQKPGSNHIAGNSGAQPADANTKMGADVQNTSANSSLQPATPAMQPTNGAKPTTGQELAAEQPESRSPAPDAVQAAPAPPSSSHEPNIYGGNFGNDVQPSFEDHDRASNQRADANRGEFGQQQYNQGSTHGGYGNQYRDVDPAIERPAAEATEEKYYGQGASLPGLQHNSYHSYDGRDLAPAGQGHAVHDTPPTAHATSTPATTNSHPQDTRNLPDRSGEAAAFQTDNGSPTTGGGYATDYGHTSGVGLPANTPDNYKPTAPGGQNQDPGQPSPRGGYDGTTPNEAAQGAPAPINAPEAPQNAGYGYGYERSEQAQPGNPQTGDSRSGFGPGGSKEGNTSQGHGSEGGSYDDENPGARGPAHDQFTQQDKAQNYGQEQRDDFRPADDKPTDGDYGPAPRRNTGRDEQ